MTAPSPKVEQRHRDAAAKLLGYKDWADATDYRLTGQQDLQVAQTAQAFAAFERDLSTPSIDGWTGQPRDLASREITPVGDGRNTEAAAWAWLEKRYADRGEDPVDVAYAADEMVDAFHAGAATRVTPSGDAEGRARELLGQAVWPMMDEAEAKAWLEKRMPRGRVGIDYALRAITAALTSAPQPLREAEWQLIETAPRNGTTVDLWGEELGRMTDCYWGRPAHDCGEAGQYCDSDWHADKAESWVDGTFNERLSDTFLTHWRPLPDASAQALAMPGDAK